MEQVANVGTSSESTKLCEELKQFMESDKHPEHQEIQTIAQKVEEIKERIIGMSREGKISSEGSFPLDKLQEVQQCVSELQNNLKKIFSIHQTVSMRWMEMKINEGFDQKFIQTVVTSVLATYQARWANMDEKA